MAFIKRRLRIHKKTTQKSIKKSLATSYSCRPKPTTFTATVLNFCVRDGNRCVLSDIITRLIQRSNNL